MKNKSLLKTILVIQGPNMNLISYRPIAAKNRLTLSKINSCLKKEAKKAGYNLKLTQTNDEAQAVTIIQRLRNKIVGIIIFPGPWQKSAHSIKDILEMLQIPFVTISTGEEPGLLMGLENIKETNILKGCSRAVKKVVKST